MLTRVADSCDHPPAARSDRRSEGPERAPAGLEPIGTTRSSTSFLLRAAGSSWRVRKPCPQSRVGSLPTHPKGGQKLAPHRIGDDRPASGSGWRPGPWLSRVEEHGGDIKDGYQGKEGAVADDQCHILENPADHRAQEVGAEGHR